MQHHSKVADNFHMPFFAKFIIMFVLYNKIKSLLHKQTDKTLYNQTIF